MNINFSHRNSVLLTKSFLWTPNRTYQTFHQAKMGMDNNWISNRKFEFVFWRLPIIETAWQQIIWAIWKLFHIICWQGRWWNIESIQSENRWNIEVQNTGYIDVDNGYWWRNLVWWQLEMFVMTSIFVTNIFVHKREVPICQIHRKNSHQHCQIVTRLKSIISRCHQNPL